MIKKHKRSRRGWMRRTSRIYLGHLNQGKAKILTKFLGRYSEALNYSIKRLWSLPAPLDRFSNDLAAKEFTDSVKARFELTARVVQCVAKQAKECVNSQSKKSKRKQNMPRSKKHVANIDSRMVCVERFNGSFDMCIKFGSGVPNIMIPFNWNKHTDKFRNDGWLVGPSVRIGYDTKGLFVDIIFEKPKPKKRTKGKLIGIDAGLNSLLYTSNGQNIGGAELKSTITKGGKRRKSYHHFITTEANRYLKRLRLTGIRSIAIEDLKYVKHNKRGKFRRNSNRLLSFWYYAKVRARLERTCEELGILIIPKNPWKTSQRCPECCKIDKKNRNGKRFKCVECGHTDDADHVGALNLELLGLAGVYSLRSLPSR